MYSALILLPFFSVIVLNILYGGLKKAAFGAALAIFAAQIYITIACMVSPSLCNLNLFGPFLKFDLTVDNLSRVLLLSIAIVAMAALFVQKYVIKEDHRFFDFVNMLLLIVAGMNGVVMVRDIFSMYVFLEVTSICSFILIAFHKDISAFEGAFKYMILSVVATALMLTSIAILLIVSGGTSFAGIAGAIQSSPDKLMVSFAVSVFLAACFIKVGLVPFHGWVPDAYSAAPASVSVLLAGIVTKTLGAYTLIRIVGSVFGSTPMIDHILLAVGALSIVFGALAAMGQRDMKRMLAYSSVSQIGYIIMGLGCGTALGIAGAVFHLFNHAIFKSLLFVNSAAVEFETGTRDMDKLSGLAQKMPVTGVTSVIGSLSCAGIPPLAGFWSKLIIIMALWIAGFHAYSVIAVLASLLTLAYFLILQRSVFFGTVGAGLANVKESGFCVAFPAVVLAAVTVLVGVLFPFVVNSFILPLGSILGR